MCSRHAEPGAGHPDNYELRAYRALVRDEDGPSWWVTVPKALGPNDAKNQAREAAYESGALSPGVIKVVPA